MIKRNFVVVAADASTRETVADDLRSRGYSVTRATSCAEAEQIVRSVAVDTVLVETNLPDGRAKRLRDSILRQRPECRVILFAGFDEIPNPPEALRFAADDYRVGLGQLLDLAEAPYLAPQEGDGNGFSGRGHRALVQVADVLVGLQELDHKHFGGFSHQAMRLACDVAQELGLDDAAIQEVTLGTLLRDVGKVNVEPDLLDEPGWYSEDQRARMQAHVDGSVRLFEHIDFPWKVLPVIRHHHERYDGAGYPDGLKGRAIPMGARVVAVVDAYIALTSGRNHRGAFEVEDALRMLIDETGRQFDPEVVEALQQVLDRSSAKARREATRLLLVDSDEKSSRPLKIRLVNEGHEVVDAANLDLALEKMLKDPPSLVVLDIDADREGAFQLLGEMRADEMLCRIPAVFVTGSRDRVVKIRALREGIDEYLQRDDELDEVVARLSGVLTREGLRRAGKPQQRRRGISGDLESLALAEIVQSLSMGMKTAAVTLRQDGRKGQIWFDNGRPRHAKVGDLAGEDAFFEMIRWQTGEFVLQHGVRCRPTTIDQDAMFLVMEGLRRMDEENQAGTTKAAS